MISHRSSFYAFHIVANIFISQFLFHIIVHLCILHRFFTFSQFFFIFLVQHCSYSYYLTNFLVHFAAIQLFQTSIIFLLIVVPSCNQGNNINEILKIKILIHVLARHKNGATTNTFTNSISFVPCKYTSKPHKHFS